MKHDLGEVSGHFWNQVSILFCFHREMLLHTSASTQGGPSHRDGFTQRDDFTKGCFYLQVLLYRDTFNTEMLLHTGALRYKYFLHRDDFAKRNF